MPFDFLKNKTILVTGGTGSFGKRFVTTLLDESEASKIIIFSRDELKQSQMQAEIADPDDRMRFFIGDVRDLQRLQRAFKGVDYVVHAAALKQVPALEYNPMEAINTNILGTQNVINAALDQGVKKILLISTDKAANPANLYGATKLCAEKLFISSNAYSGDKTTRFSVVRYGNVLGSRGSLLEIIEQQRKSGVITLTHDEMTRFWITLEQGVKLVLDSLEKMIGGEIFIPNIPCMKVKDFIELVAPECTLKITGIRPGEKLHEMLITPEESRHALKLDDIFVILPEHDWWKEKEHTRVFYGNGKKLEEGFCFVSNMEEKYLDEQSLKSLLDSI